MTYDFSNIPNLKNPVKTTPDDAIFSGHGSLDVDGSEETTVPEGMEIWFLAPPGASISDHLGQALEAMKTIDKLAIVSPQNDDLTSTQPQVYKSGQKLPDYELHEPSGLKLKPNGPHILGVSEATSLSALWERVKPFVKPDQTVRCFWAACTAIDGASNPVVDYP